MIPAPFRYTRASTVEDAIRALVSDSEAKLLSGGHSLLPLMKLRLARPSLLVDVTQIPELTTIGIASDMIGVGAAVRYVDILASNRVGEIMPVLGEAVRVIADPQVRHRGTIGGSAAHADPTSDLAAVFLATDAQFVAAGPHGERRIAADAWYVAPLVTALESDEVLVRIEIPRPLPSRQTYLKFPHPASGYALAGTAALLEVDADGRVSRARIAVTGAGVMPFRARTAEHRLEGQLITAGLVQDAALAGAGDGDYVGDRQYEEDYRQNLASVMIRRALERLALD